MRSELAVFAHPLEKVKLVIFSYFKSALLIKSRH